MISGTNILAEDGQGRRSSSSSPAPFANIVLADEINRATPKTQSDAGGDAGALGDLVAGKLHRLEEPFFVLATQNPHRDGGHYPLPECALDEASRFKLRSPAHPN